MYIEKGSMLDTLACQKACVTPPPSPKLKYFLLHYMLTSYSDIKHVET